MYTDAAMRKAVVRVLALLAAVLAIVFALHPRPEREGSESASEFRLPAARPLPVLDPDRAETRIVSSGRAPSVHSATAVEISGGRIRAFWYGGSREGASDVAIYSAVWEPGAAEWSPERRVVSRQETASDLDRYVKKLGNPVIARDERGRLWLFYVSVSMGGWSGSAINVRLSEDEGETFGPARRLVTSPFLNVSTLVRGPMVSYSDGAMGLPVYHEFLGKFGEWLRLSPEGRVLGKARLGHGRSSLQPVVVPRSPTEALAFLRSSGSSPRRVLASETRDGGFTWTSLQATTLPNPDAAISAIPTEEGILLAFNDSEEDRSRLTLALTKDSGKSFRNVYVFGSPSIATASEAQAPRFAYPWLLSSSNGDLHVLYSWNRRAIVHVRFPSARGTLDGGG